MGPSDLSLLERWRTRRDALAFQEIALRHAGMVYAACNRVLRDGAEAEDIAQECFEKLAAGNGPGPRRNLGAWLHTTAVNACKDRMRSQQRRRNRESAYALERERAMEPPLRDLCVLIDEAIGELPEDCRAAIIACFFEGRTHHDAARELGVSRQTVARRVQRGIEQLRGIVGRKDVQISSAGLAGFLDSSVAEAAPATLTTALGKLSLAGAMASDTSAVATATTGGLIMAKKAAIIGIALAALSIFAWRLGVSGDAGDREVDTLSPSSAPIVIPLASASELAGEDFSTDPANEAMASETGLETPENDPRIEETPLPIGIGGAIAGRVYDAGTGEGIEGAEVGLYAFDDNPFNDPPLVLAISDESGRYTLIPPGEGKYYILRGTTPNYPHGPSREVKTILVQGPETVEGMDFPVAMGLSVAGRVVDSSGRPVAGAVVKGRESTSFTLQEGVTDDNGEFLLAGFEASDGLYIRAEHEIGISKPHGPYEIVEDGLEGIEVVIRPSAAVSGVVVDEYGTPRPGAGIRIAEDIRVSWWNEDISADEFGRFSAAPLHPGSYELFVGPASSGFQPAISAGAITLGPGQYLSNLRLVYGGGIVMSGRVTDNDGRPIEGARLQYGSSALLQFALTDSDGEYGFEMLPEGAVTVYVNAPGYNTEMFPDTIPDGRPIDFELDRADTPVTVSGRVVYADTGEPVTVFEIASHADPGMESNDASRYMHVQDPDGQFILEDLNTYGLRHIAVRAAGFPTSFVRLSAVEPGAVLDGLVVELDGGLFVQGVVLDPAGTPVADALVFGGPVADFNRPRVALARTDLTGSFQVTLDTTRSRLLTAVRVGYAAGAVELPAEPESPLRVEIRLHRESVVEGRVTYEGDPIHMKNLVRVNHPWLEQGMEIQSDTDANGVYRVDGLPPGPVVVEALYNIRANEWRVVHEEVVLEEGYVTVVDFDIKDPVCVLEGIIANAGGPYVRMAVEVFVDTGAGSERGFAWIAEDGSFRIEGLPAGTARVEVYDVNARRATRDAGTLATVTAELTLDSTTQIAIDLSQP